MGAILQQRQRRCRRKHPSVGAVPIHWVVRHCRTHSQSQELASRWRHSTARPKRWRRSAASSASKGFTPSFAGTLSSPIPPLCINEQQIARGVLPSLIAGLEITDKAVSSCQLSAFQLSITAQRGWLVWGGHSVRLRSGSGSWENGYLLFGNGGGYPTRPCGIGIIMMQRKGPLIPRLQQLTGKILIT